MNAERNHDWNQHDDMSAFQSHGGSSALVQNGPSTRWNLIVSEPIYQSGILRFSVTSQRSRS